MSENTQTVVERAQREAWGMFPDTRSPGGYRQPQRLPAVETYVLGATFAATITPEQVEAAAQELQTSEYLLGRIAGIVWCRRRVQATFTAAGFQVEADS